MTGVVLAFHARCSQHSRLVTPKRGTPLPCGAASSTPYSLTQHCWLFSACWLPTCAPRWWPALSIFKWTFRKPRWAAREHSRNSHRFIQYARAIRHRYRSRSCSTTESTSVLSTLARNSRLLIRLSIRGYTPPHTSSQQDGSMADDIRNGVLDRLEVGDRAAAISRTIKQPEPVAWR